MLFGHDRFDRSPDSGSREQKLGDVLSQLRWPNDLAQENNQATKYPQGPRATSGMTSQLGFKNGAHVQIAMQGDAGVRKSDKRSSVRQMLPDVEINILPARTCMQA